jgi:uncharacterized protein (DUF433 family)
MRPTADTPPLIHINRAGRRMMPGVIIHFTMDTELIQTDPAVMMGKPVVAGTRITVELILEKLAAGESPEQLLEAHPRLTKEAILAALAYAAETLHNTHQQIMN